MRSAGPVGADAVVAPRPTAAGVLRLALLRARARGRLHAGRGVRVAAGARVTVARAATVELGDGAVLGPGSRIEAVAGAVRLGPGARLGERAVVTALASVELAANAIVGDWALVADAEPTWDDPETPIRHQPLRTAPVRLGERARLGAHVAVGPGVTVGPGAVVGSYAVIDRDVPAGAVVERNWA